MPHERHAAAVACSPAEGETRAMTAAEVEEVGNLVADDEWLGLAMELAIVLRSSVRESAKKNVRDFTGKDEYKIGDVSKELDARVKGMVAEYRNKDEYELGDLSIALDTMAKEEVKKMTGKDECKYPQHSKCTVASPLLLACSRRSAVRSIRGGKRRGG